MKYILLLITILWASSSYAQPNLVPNPSFEQLNCPTGYTGFSSQIEDWVIDWYSGNCASPDPHTACSADSNTQVPNVWFGHQDARTGSAYLAFGFYDIGGSPWYEYVGTKLTQPLLAGQQYEVSFYVSRADCVRYASDDIGMYFSTEKDSCDGGFAGPVLAYTPQVKNAAGMLIGTANWMLVQGTYTARGGEEHILIGCFTPWDLLRRQDFGSGAARCYYYLDDVSVRAAMQTPITEELTEDVNIFVDRTNNKLYISRGNASGRLGFCVVDIHGKILYDGRLDTGEKDRILDFGHQKSGIYFVRLKRKKSILIKKIIK